MFYILKWWRDFRQLQHQILHVRNSKNTVSRSQPGERRPARPLQGHPSCFLTPTLRRREARMTGDPDLQQESHQDSGNFHRSYDSISKSGNHDTRDAAWGLSSLRPVALAPLQMFSPRNVVSCSSRRFTPSYITEGHGLHSLGMSTVLLTRPNERRLGGGG